MLSKSLCCPISSTPKERKRKGPDGVSFVPHVIDDDSGVGTQVTAADLNKAGRPDVVVGNKKETFVHLSQQQR